MNVNRSLLLSSILALASPKVAYPNDNCFIQVIMTGTTRAGELAVGEMINHPRLFQDISECNRSSRRVANWYSTQLDGDFWGIVESITVQCKLIADCEENILHEDPKTYVYLRNDWLKGWTFEQAISQRTINK